MGDPFIRAYIDDVLKNIRTQVVIKLIKPYTRIDINFISKVTHNTKHSYGMLTHVVFSWKAIEYTRR